MRLLAAMSSLIVLILSAGVVSAQSTPSPTPEPVPRLVTISGVFRPADRQPAGRFETVTLSLYAEKEGGTPLWQERQTIAIDAQGRYSLLLGATHPDGIPAAVFGDPAAHWIGILFERPGEVEGPRSLLTSTPYAIRAADADTLGGLPASAYLLAPPTGAGRAATTKSTSAAQSDVGANVVLPGTTNFLAKYANSADVGASGVFETAGAVGIGTTTPLDRLHVRYDNNTGQFTGLAVQNTNGGALAYSGMLFYDHTNALTQFQGYNNSTHEYRINNIARVSPGGAFNGTINFMIGSTSRFFVGSSGGVGIGTTSAGPGLEVSNALTGALVANIAAQTYGNNAFGGTFVARKARGTQAAPVAVQNNDQLAIFAGVGYATTHSGNFGNGMSVNAAENYTDTAQGTALNFYTTKRGTNAPVAAMTLNDAGNLGIGTSSPGAPLEVSRVGQSAVVVKTFGADAAFITNVARGTPAAPAGVQLGDSLGFFGGSGYSTTAFSEPTAGMGAFAAENWTDAAKGSLLAFFTTQLGSNDERASASMAIMPDGNVGIGTFTDIPTVADKLQVFGDIRVGTTGTNGCIKNFGGNPLAGTCSSDRRFKKDITPFDHVLDHLTALQPVHYSWRASEFPDRHFGDSRAYGLVAQDVEQVLPELVVTNDDGFKAVDYSELPLLTIQAVKELKSKVEELNTENDTLKQRLAELERQMSELLAAPRR
jgi:hypothetical protein